MPGSCSKGPLSSSSPGSDTTYRLIRLYLRRTTSTALTTSETNSVCLKEICRLLAVAGFSQEEVTKYDLANMTDEELHNLVRQRLLGVMANNGSHQKVAPIGKVECFLSEGYEYVASISNDRAIIKMPF